MTKNLMKPVFPFARYEVAGNSMFPAFQSGDRVLVWRWGTVREGDVVVFCKNGMKMVKRAVKKTSDRWIMRGDNLSASTDSADFGPVEEKAFEGKVLTRYFINHPD